MNTMYNYRNALPQAGRLLTALTVLWMKNSGAGIGDFESQTDIGNPAKSGGAEYNEARQEYHLSGAGSNMWFGSDEFHFVWKQLEGDFILNAQAEFVGPGANAHRKLGWMVRSNSRQVAFVSHTTPQPSKTSAQKP